MIRIVLFSITMGLAAVLFAYWGILESTSLQAAEADEVESTVVAVAAEEAPREPVARQKVIEASTLGGANGVLRRLQGLGPRE